MEWEKLVGAFRLLSAPYSKAYGAQPPTEVSIERINRSLGIVLPPVFIKFARECPIYGTWFASIGEDFESFMHLLELNRVFHEAEGDEPGDPRPPWLVMINHGHDGDCDCLDSRTYKERTGDYLIQHWRDRRGRENEHGRLSLNISNSMSEAGLKVRPRAYVNKSTNFLLDSGNSRSVRSCLML